MVDPPEPPRQVWFDLDEALELLVLEELREELASTGKLTLVPPVEAQIGVLHRKQEFDEGGGV